MDDLIKEMNEWENNRSSFVKWVDRWFGGSLAGYRVSYAIVRPHVVMDEAMRQLLWAAQRVIRGWDDRVCWSIDWWMNTIMPDILLQFMENTHGTPMDFYDGMEPGENYSYTADQDDIASLLWKAELWKMIAGFKAAQELSDLKWDSEEERKRLEDIHKVGMESFVKHYQSLWD